MPSLQMQVAEGGGAEGSRFKNLPNHAGEDSSGKKLSPVLQALLMGPASGSTVEALHYLVMGIC